MPLVRNRSEVPHRYYDYGRKAYVVWAPGEVRDVPHAVAQQVCGAHPDKMELVLPPPEPEPVEAPVDVSEDPNEEPAEIPDDFTKQAVDRAQRGGSRRSTKQGQGQRAVHNLNRSVVGEATLSKPFGGG